MAAKKVFVVPHGAKFPGPDPLMTSEGVEQIGTIKSHLPTDLSQVWRGEGRRHGQVAEVLGLTPTHYNGLWGPASSVERRPDGPMTVLPDGTVFPFSPKDAWIFRASLLALIEAEVMDGAVVCAGRESLMALTGKKANELKTGLYKVTVDDGLVTCECLFLAPGDF